MLFELIFGRHGPAVDHVSVGSRDVALLIVRNPRARRYLLRLRPDGSARVTIPRGGSVAAARKFVERNTAWLERQLQQLQAQPRKPAVWKVGAEIFLRGDVVRIEAGRNGESGYIRFGNESLQVSDLDADLRPAIEVQLRKVAERELPPRVMELAARHRLAVRRVTVRNQRTRWGSCSRRGTISLNWRLIQTPSFVQDYICIHELMHLREMNHSLRYWREVERVCPEYRNAERWLKQHPGLLR